MLATLADDKAYVGRLLEHLVQYGIRYLAHLNRVQSQTVELVRKIKK